MSSRGQPEPSSWGDSIRQYENSKKVLPFAREDVIPVKRIGLCERRVLERELDPILMQYRDTKKEENFLDMSRSKSEAHINKPRQKMAGTLNIFSGQLPARTGTSNTSRRKLQRDWNLISHFPVDVHEKVQITADFEQTERLRPRTTVNLKALRAKNGREFNVVSNEYFENNQERQDADFEQIKGDVQKKYWKTHDFDFIKGQYIDGEKEAKYREQRAMLGAVQGASQYQKLPPGMVYASGNSYNIINQEVTDELKLQVSDAVVDRNRNRLKSHEVSQKLSASATLKEEFDRERHQNRVSYQRWEKELDRGYDPIFRNDLTAEHINTVAAVPNNRLSTRKRAVPNQDVGPPGRSLEAPHVARPETVWDRIQRDDVNNVTALFNATGNTQTLKCMAEAFKSSSQGGSSGRAPMARQTQNLHSARPLASSASSVRTGSAVLSSRPEPVISGRQLGEVASHKAHRDLTRPVAETGLGRSASHGNVFVSQLSSARANNNSSGHVLVKNSSVPNLQSGRPVPSLDLSRTETPPLVSYNHDTSGPPGQPVAIVRTGGGGFAA